MSSQTSPSSSSHSSLASGDGFIEHSESDIFSSYSSDMLLGTPPTKKGTTGFTRYEQTLQTSEVNRLSWKKEIEGKISVLDGPVSKFLDVFVPEPNLKVPKKASRKVIASAFKNLVVEKSSEAEKYPYLIKGLRNLVAGFDVKVRPAFGDGSHCKVPFPFEYWGKEQHYTMPDIVMSLPGNAEAGWKSAWSGISTVFEVKRDKSEDPVDEGSATIKTSGQPMSALIQISKSARNLLHTHRLLYAYVVGIYNDKARIFRFDHAAGVVSRAIDLQNDPHPLYEFLWRFCNYSHSAQFPLVPPCVVIRSPTQIPLPAETVAAHPYQTRSMTRPPRAEESGDAAVLSDDAGTRCFLGMDPTVFAVSKNALKMVNKLLSESNPPQKLLSPEEEKSCRWVAFVKERNPDGSAKTTKWYILYRLRFLNPRLFSRATRVWDAYDAETWEPRAIKDAWRQLARDREDLLYVRLRDQLRKRNDLEQLVEECKNYGLSQGDDLTDDGDDSRSDAPPPSTAADNESVHELNAEGAPIIAEELEALSNTLLYGLPDVEVGDDLGAHEAHRLFETTGRRDEDQSQATRASPSDVDLDSLARGEDNQPPAYDVYHRTICAWLREKDGQNPARFNERSHMRLVMKTVGRPLSSFNSTKEMVTAIRDAIIGHMLAFKAGLIHRDLSDGNVMITDGGLFYGFLLDLDYAFNWMEALELAGQPVDEATWASYVDAYNERVVDIERPAGAGQVIPPLVEGREMPQASRATNSGASWRQRMKMKERTGTLFFMAAEVLATYVAHDARHDLESAIWLLLCMVLRHTLQVRPTDQGEFERYELYLRCFDATTESDSFDKKNSFLTKSMRWAVKNNAPLTQLIRHLKLLVRKQNRSPEAGDGEPIPLTYKSVLTEFNQALALPGWPNDDAALPFTLPRDGGSSESKGTKHPREEEGLEPHSDAASASGSSPLVRAAKKPMLGPSPLRNEVDDDPFL